MIKFSKETEQNICDDYKSGSSLDKIYEKYNSHKKKTISILEKNNIEIRNNLISNDVKDAILKESNLSEREIAKKYNVSYSSVNLLLKKQTPGILTNKTPREKSIWIKENIKEVVNMYENGSSLDKISDYLDFDKKSIRLILKNQGVIFRSLSESHKK